MKRRFPSVLLLLPTGLILLFFVACGPAVLPVTETPAPSRTLEPSPTPVLDTPTFVCDGLCPEDSMTVTAAVGATFAAIPTNTPPPWATVIPGPGDLGWGSVHGNIVDGATMLPLEGATVTCEQVSDSSPYLCNGVTATDSDGNYSFQDFFLRKGDRITLVVEAPGYTPWRFENLQSFTIPTDFHADLGLFPLTNGSPTPTMVIMMCTSPACSGGVLVCNEPNGCKGGCGAICVPGTATP